MKFWITTDTHLGHDNIIKYCNRPLDYNKRIIRGLSCLKYGDVLIHLGDVAFSDAGEREYLRNIPCKKWLVRGNHDKKYMFHLNLGWDWVGESFMLRCFGVFMKFSHKPVPIGEEDIQFHGHFHNAPSDHWEGWLKQILTSKHQLLILENLDYKPIDLEQLLKEARNG